MNMKKHISIIILAVCSIFTLSANSNISSTQTPAQKKVEAHTLFTDKHSDYSIVIAEKASPSEQYAAKELQKYLKESGSVELPITKNLFSKGKHIYVGYNRAVARLTSAKAPAAKDESFVYRNVGSNLIIYGGSQRGTMYGVFTFLEKELGCRWYTPSVTVVPKRDSWGFTKLNHAESPGIQIRNDFYYEAFDPAWAAHNRCNGRLFTSPHGMEQFGGTESYWGAHTLGQFIPASEFFDAHPEYFSLIDGKRDKDAQICLSNPEVLKIVIERLKKTIRENPGYRVYDVSQNDRYKPCQCDECRALAKKYGGESGVMIWFVNQVAAAIEKEFPDVYVGTFAYQYTRKPPVNIVPRKNVVVRLCSIEGCFLHSLESCPENATFIEDMQGWAKIAPHLYIWDYVVTFSQYVGPFPNFDVLQPNIQSFKKNHAIGIMEQGQYQSRGGELSELRAYLIAKLLWDPNCNVNSVVNDFIYGYYGKSAKFIRQYYTLLMALVKPYVHMSIYPTYDNPIFSDVYISKASEIFGKALRAADNSEIRHRVELVTLPILYLKCMRNPVKSMSNGTYQEFLRIAERDSVRVSEGMDLAAFRQKMEKKK